MIIITALVNFAPRFESRRIHRVNRYTILGYIFECNPSQGMAPCAADAKLPDDLSASRVSKSCRAWKIPRASFRDGNLTNTTVPRLPTVILLASPIPTCCEKAEGRPASQVFFC